MAFYKKTPPILIGLSHFRNVALVFWMEPTFQFMLCLLQIIKVYTYMYIYSNPCYYFVLNVKL